MKKETTMTLAEALKQGYTHCAGNPEDGFQSLFKLEDLTQDEIDNNPCYLAEQESNPPRGLPNWEIREPLALIIDDYHFDETGDDTGEVYNIISSLDFSDVEQRITEALKDRAYRDITTIRLV